MKFEIFCLFVVIACSDAHYLEVTEKNTKKEIGYLLITRKTLNSYSELTCNLDKKLTSAISSTFKITLQLALDKISKMVTKENKIFMHFEILLLNMLNLKKFHNLQLKILISKLSYHFLDEEIFFTSIFCKNINETIKNSLIFYLLPCIYSKMLYIPQKINQSNDKLLENFCDTKVKQNIAEFNNFLIKFYDSFQNIFKLNYRQYMKIISDNMTSQKIMTRNVLVFLKKLLNSRIFYKLKLFCPYLQKLFNSERFYNISDIETKRAHYFLCILSLKFKTLTEVMYEDLDSLFREKYIPIYKLVIFQNLYFNILLYSYLSNILSYFRFMKNNELILHMYNYYRLMYVNRHLQNLDCIYEEEYDNATKLKGKKYEIIYKKLDNKYLALIKINI